MNAPAPRGEELNPVEIKISSEYFIRGSIIQILMKFHDIAEAYQMKILNTTI